MRAPVAIRALPTLLRVGLADAVAYRAEFVVWMLTMSLPLVMMALWTAVAREAPVGRFDDDAFVAYFLATLAVRQTTGTWVVWEMNQSIRDGTLALRLLRPLHPLVGYAAEAAAQLPLRLLLCSPLLAYLVVGAPSRHLTHDPRIVALLPVAMVGAWLITFGFMAMIGTLALYLQSSREVWEIWLGAFAVLSGYLMPLELLPPWVSALARWLPFPYMLALPVEMLVGLRDLSSTLSGLAAQWAWVFASLFLMQLAWRRAERHFNAFGG